MAINSVSSSGVQQQQALSNVQQNVKPAQAEREQANKQAEAAAAEKKAAATPAPTVNTNGQVIGSTINVTA